MNLPVATPHDNWLIVRAGGQRFAIAAQAVREIVPAPRLTRVPLGPDILRGLGSIRGETLAVLSLAQLMRPEQMNMEGSSEGHLLVLEGAIRAGVLVDRIERFERARTRNASCGSVGEAPVPVPDIAELIAAKFPVRSASHRTRTSLPDVRLDARDDRLGLLRISIGSQHFAFPLEQVDEVLRADGEIAVLPWADDAVVGSIAWRDQTLAVLSLAKLLGLPATPLAPRRIVVVRSGQGHLGLAVDMVDAVLHATPDRIDPVPSSLLRGESEARIAAIYRPEGNERLVSILSADKVIHEDQIRRLSSGMARSAESPATSAVPMPGEIAILPLILGAERMAVPVAAIRQVLPRPLQMTRVPEAPDWLCGLALVDGSPIPVIDQVLRFTGMRAEGRRQRMLVMEFEGMKLGFLFTATQGIERADVLNFAAAPLPDTAADGIVVHTLSPKGDDLDEGEKEPLLLIDPGALVSSIERSMLKHMSSAATAENA